MYVVPLATQYTGVDSPATAEAIKRAFTRIQTSANTDAGVARQLGIGNFVGPNPRVTRDIQINMDLRGGQVTRASWLYSMPDPRTDQMRTDQLTRLRDQLLDELRREAAGGEWVVTIGDYEADRNGSVAWWQSGSAATDATYINSWPAFRTPDSAIGPNDSDPVGGGIDLTPPLPNLPHVSIDWKVVALYAGGAALLWYGTPLLLKSMMSSKRVPAPARARRRTRR